MDSAWRSWIGSLLGQDANVPPIEIRLTLTASATSIKADATAAADAERSQGPVVPCVRSINCGTYSRTGAGPPSRRTSRKNRSAPSSQTPCGDADAADGSPVAWAGWPASC